MPGTNSRRRLRVWIDGGRPACDGCLEPLKQASIAFGRIMILFPAAFGFRGRGKLIHDTLAGGATLDVIGHALARLALELIGEKSLQLLTRHARGHG